MNRDGKNFNGKEFLRNVSIEQEKSELEEQQNRLEQQKRDSFEENNSMYNEDMSYSNNNNRIPEDSFVDFEEEEQKAKVFDLKLENNPKKKVSSTKKYIILSIGLSILFILIIIGLRVNSNKNEENKLNTIVEDKAKVEPEKVAEKVNGIQEYKDIIEAKKEEQKELEKKDILLPEQLEYKKPTLEDKTIKEENNKNDLFEINKKKEEEKARKLLEKQRIERELKAEREEEKRRIEREKQRLEAARKLREKKRLEEQKAAQENKRRKESVIPPVQEKDLDKPSNLAGYYIQIGAFSKKPNQSFKNNILRKGFNYQIYEVNVKGKIFYKVLIGPYPVKSLALKVISDVKKEFNNQNAYILKF
ncbi:MAG: SPOR domain-containing protein [Campylobacterota bacterium]|nr:SPOR domain-containing protein [Campylobacterota bacterium]